MTQKLNCWQYKNCGREKGGLLAEVLGVCPASTSMKHDGTNGGKAAGRACWKVSGACLREENRACGYSSACHKCAFYHRVRFEEADSPITTDIPTATPKIKERV